MPALNAVALMQELASDRLTQAESAAFPEFNHAPDGLAAVFPVKAAVARQAGQSVVWFEFDCHNLRPNSHSLDAKN